MKINGSKNVPHLTYLSGTWQCQPVLLFLFLWSISQHCHYPRLYSFEWWYDWWMMDRKGCDRHWSCHMSICYPGIHLKLLRIIKEDWQVMRFLQQCSRGFCSSGILGHVSWMGPNILRQPNVIFKDQATKMKLCCLETFGSDHPLPWLHIPKEQNPQGKPVTEVGVPAETQTKNLSDAFREALLSEPVCKEIISFTANMKFCN